MCGGPATKPRLVPLDLGALAGHCKGTMHLRALFANVAKSQTSLAYRICVAKNGVERFLFTFLSILEGKRLPRERHMLLLLSVEF